MRIMHFTAAGVPYDVSIAAVNRAGLGEFTVFTHFTRELAPSIAPKNVTLSRPSPTVMVVSWIPLTYSEARGFISQYTCGLHPPHKQREKETSPSYHDCHYSWHDCQHN